METIIAILLYLSVIVSPGSYYQSEIDTYVAQNQVSVDAIVQDQMLTNQIVSDYADEVRNVDIIDVYQEY